MTFSAAEATLRLPAASIALEMKAWLPSARAAVANDQAPVCYRRSRCPIFGGSAVEYLHGAAGHRGAGQGLVIDVGDAVAGHPAIGRERRHRRGGRGCDCIDGDVQRLPRRR